MAIIVPDRTYRGRAAGGYLSGPPNGHVQAITGLPADVPDAEIFRSDPIFVAGFHTFELRIDTGGGIPLNTVECQVLYLDPFTLAILTGDFLGATAGVHTRLPFGAGTGLLDPFPWIMIEFQVTSNDGGVVGLGLTWKLELA